MNKELYSYEDILIDAAYAATRQQAYTPSNVFGAILALSNWTLARAADREETLDRAANRKLAGLLLDCFARERGMQTVGVHAETWFDLGARIALADEEDWMRFCRDDEKLYSVFDEIEEGWFSATAKDWRDPYNGEDFDDCDDEDYEDDEDCEDEDD